MIDITATAGQLLRAREQARLLPLPSEQGDFTLEQAYAVAELARAQRVSDGERPLGYKIGFTNRSIWPRYNVFAPIWAPVWDSTVQLLDAPTSRVSLAGLVQPRIEPEIVFAFARAPQRGVGAADLVDCLEWVAHGVEIVQTHFDGWRFTAPDSVADFGLHGRLVVGPRVPVSGFASLGEDLARLELELFRDGESVDQGQGSLVLDSPLQALHLWLQAMTVQSPQWQVRAGDIVTTGTLTDAWPISAGEHWQTRLSDARLSALALQFEE